MIKISDLGELDGANIDNEDLLEIVDTSDHTTMGSVKGTNRKVKVSSLSNKFMGDADSKFIPLYTNLPANQIGDLSYLDLDIKGDYKGAQSSNYEKPYVVKERNGNFVGIRGGYNGLSRKQFYFTSPTDEFLPSTVGLTDIEYRPKFLAATEYVSNLIDGNADGFCAIIRNTVDSTKKFYWIRVNGTMDSAKHTPIDITTLFTTPRSGVDGSETFSNNFQSYVGPSASVVYCPEKQYWIATTRSNNEGIRFYVFNSSFDQLGDTFLQVNLKTDVDYGTLGAGATATATVAAGALTLVTVGLAGANYISAPSVTFTGGGGSGATATSTIVDGKVTKINILTPGTGYTSAPTVVISGDAYTFMYTDHTNRNNIQYDYDAVTNVLTITNLVSLVIYYANNLAGGLYNSACTFNCNTNICTQVFTNKVNNKWTPNEISGFSNPQAYVAPFFSAVPKTHGTTPYYWADIKLRKFYNIGDGIVIETGKDHSWEPTHFNIIKHTLETGKTWKDFILNPYAKGDNACSTYLTPRTNPYGEQLHYVDDASLLGKDIRFASFISPTRILLKAQSKNANETSPVRRRVIAKIDDMALRQKIVTANDSLATPSNVVKSTLPILDNNKCLHTVIDSIGNMRVKVLDGAVFKEINCDTGIGADGSPSAASITNANVFTLPSNYTILISNIVKSDSLKIGKATNWRTGDDVNLCGENWVDHSYTNYDWHIYHLKTIGSNAKFLLVYGYYSYDVATTTGTVRSCYQIINCNGTSFTTIGTATKIADWTSINGVPIRNLSGIDSAAVEAAGGSRYGGNTMTCGIYDDNTTGEIFCIFKGIGCGGPGTNNLPTAAIKVNITTGIVTAQNRHLTSSPTWHTESPCIHPVFGPCIIRAHEDEMTKIYFRFVNNISTISNIHTRIKTCFATLLALTPSESTYYDSSIPGTDNLTLLTLQAAQGFNVYTSEIPVFMNGSYYKMTPTAYDTGSIARTLGATPASPKSLYAYVELVNGAPVLIFNKTFIANTATLTYVGEIKTDGIRIIYSKFAKSSDFTGGNQDIAGTEGYQKLPGGLILQWGKYVGPYAVSIPSTTRIQLPIAFPSTILYAGISEDGTAVAGYESAQIDWTSTGKTTNTHLGIYMQGPASGNMETRWYAIGY